MSIRRSWARIRIDSDYLDRIETRRAGHGNETAGSSSTSSDPRHRDAAAVAD
jgi:hypothetical protein